MRPREHYKPEYTAAPMGDKTTIRLLLAMKVAHGLISEHFDIKSAYVPETYKHDNNV